MPSKTALRDIARKSNKLRLLLTEPGYRRALTQRVAAAIEHNKVTFARQYQTVIDVGANRGQFALFALHRFPNAQILCFEPLPDASRMLLRVVGHNPRVNLVQRALGAEDGSVDINVAHSDDSSSLLMPTDLQRRTFPNTDAASSIKVGVTTLDNAIDMEHLMSPFLLKIDVQGFELEVLMGAERLLKEDGDILVEASFAELYAGQALADEVIVSLLSHGYRLRGIFSITHGLDGAPLQGDFLFSRSAMTHEITPRPSSARA